MFRNFGLKASLLVVMVALCVCVPIVNAEVVNWTSPTTEWLYSVFMLSSDDGWAVGNVGTIIHWDGTEWSNVTSPTTQSPKSVYMVSSDDGWAVGIYCPIIHWDGTEWSTVTSPAGGFLRSVYMVSSDDGWGVGWEGTILQWTGTEWIIPEFPPIVLMPLLIGVTLVAVILTKTASKKRRRPLLPSKTPL